MSQTPDPGLREIIYSQIAETYGSYLLIYSGSGEKLAFLSIFLKGLKTKAASKLLIDLGMQKYIDKFKVRGTTLIGSLSEIAEKGSLESFFPEFVRSEIEKLTKARGSSAHTVIAIDMSSLFTKEKEGLDQDIYSLHKNIVDLIRSLKNVTAILLHDVDSLSENLMFKLVGLHAISEQPLKRFSNPTAIKEEPKARADAGITSPQILALNGGIMFFDPPSRSAAALLLDTDTIKEVLPNDPLDAAHRNVAFENNYTAHEGACPYFSSEVPSGCKLDPNVMSAFRLRGRSFIEGHPCITAVDHSLIEEKQSKNTDGKRDSDSNRYGNGGANGFTFGIRNRTG
jgi:hypothetical protein